MPRGVVFDRDGALVQERTNEQVLFEILHPLFPHLKLAELASAEEASRAAWREQTHELPRGQRWGPEIRRTCLQATIDALGLPENEGEVLSRLEQYWDVFRVKGLSPGAALCLTALGGARRPLAVFAQSLRSSIEVRGELERLGIARHFAVILSAEDLPWDKPDVHVFDAIAVKMGLSPAELYYVGSDPVLDVVGPREAGLEPILIDRSSGTGGARPSEVRTVANLAQLPSLLSGLP